MNTTDADKPVPECPLALEGVLCTEEFNHRPARTPDLGAENRAFLDLAQKLADTPSSILQTLADTIVELLGAGSAVISLLSDDVGEKRFHWPAVAGAWKDQAGRGTDRRFSPCGDVLDRRSPLLFRRIERRYHTFAAMSPPALECLLVPLYLKGQAVGTLWAVTHDERRLFDREDLRLLTDLARFASAAISVCRAPDAAGPLAAIVESSDDAILSKNLDAIIQTWNSGAERLFGYTAQEVIGQSVTMLIPPERHDEEPRILDRIRRGERVDHYETIRRRKDGTLIDVSLTVSPIYGHDGRIVGASKIARDITPRKQAEHELRRLNAELSDADRRKTEFLAILAHELRNPLAPISNAIQLLEITRGSGEAFEPALETLKRQVAQMVRLVDDLLDVSRVSRGSIELRRERIDLATVVEHAVETARSYLQCRKHELEVSLPPQSIYLNGDPARLAQALGNLLNNACKYTETSGRVSLLATQEDAEVVIRVRDNGIGIAADHLSRIFELFTQVDSSLERRQSGLGIGLTLVRKLVELHGGSVRASSPGLGLGSEFVVRLPVWDAASQAESTAPSAVESARGSGRRILIVDDNRDSANSLAMLLQLTGNETWTVHDGLEAVDAAASFHPDVVLLAIGQPRLNGYEAARKIREQPWSKGMVLIAVTGWGQAEDRERSRAAGFDAHLVKPLDYVALDKVLAGFPPRAPAGRTSKGRVER